MGVTGSPPECSSGGDVAFAVVPHSRSRPTAYLIAYIPREQLSLMYLIPESIAFGSYEMWESACRTRMQ